VKYITERYTKKSKQGSVAQFESNSDLSNFPDVTYFFIMGLLHPQVVTSSHLDQVTGFNLGPRPAILTTKSEVYVSSILAERLL
jgi:hypothetical protein